MSNAHAIDLVRSLDCGSGRVDELDAQCIDETQCAECELHNTRLDLFAAWDDLRDAQMTVRIILGA